MFPKTVVALYNGFEASDQDGDGKNSAGGKGERGVARLRDLQKAIAAGEELIVKWGTVGVKEGVSRVLGFGDRRGTRLPMKGGLPEAAWKEFEGAFEELGRIEGSLSMSDTG